MSNKSWFRIKKYPHLGLPLAEEGVKKLVKYILDPQKVSEHGFYPFIHKHNKSRKYRKEKNHDGTRSQLRVASIKVRDLYYANNIDSNIYSYYAYILQENYEKLLFDKNLVNIPTAYRSIPLDLTRRDSRNKCNIDFANEVFSFIKQSNRPNLIAITFDVRSFFDNLDHSLLKKAWKNVMGFDKELPKDHYNVFRNLTKFSYVEERDIFKTFKNSIVTKVKSGKIINKKVDRLQYLKNKDAIAFCGMKQINILRENNLIKSNKYENSTRKKLRTKGIPQGSPISSVLANIYMLNFDETINKIVGSKHGIYRRYSDDIIIIVPKKFEKEIIAKVNEEISRNKLQIQDNKTQVFLFRKFIERYYCFEKNLYTQSLNTNTLFEYLGFAFDGKYIRLKSASLAKYYRKMKRSVRRGFFYSTHNKTKTKGELFKSRLYKRYTFKGSQRRRVFKRDKKITNYWRLTKKYDWGNFLSYAYMAARIMPDNIIDKQLKNHWKIFHKLIKPK